MELITTAKLIRIGTILAGGLVAWIGVRRACRWVRGTFVEGEIDEDSERRLVTLVRALRYALGIVIVVVVGMLLLSEFGVSITPLLGAAGIAGVAVGLAAQGLAKDFLRGFSLLLDNQIRVGDDVEIAGKRGVVEQLTLRSVKLREPDGTVHFVRTGQVDTVTNRSLGRP